MKSTLWFSNAQLITPPGLRRGAVGVSRSRIHHIQARPPKYVDHIDLRGRYLAPGFIDLHVWGDSGKIARAAVRHGTTAFLRTIGPESSAHLKKTLNTDTLDKVNLGARCLGLHFEGPYVNRDRCGALPARWIRDPKKRELIQLARGGRGKLRLVTIAPELPGALSAIELFVKNKIVASLGHSTADARSAEQAVTAGARAVTHVFNGMSSLNHKKPGLIDVALNDARIITMVIADGIHVSRTMLQMLFKLKSPQGVALVTDSITLQGWDVIKKKGACYTKRGVLAGSCLTMMQAVANAVKLGKISILEAVRMASETPARLLGVSRTLGSLVTGKYADLVVFDKNFNVYLTMVGGQIVYRRKR